jgi:hypothetical protein
MSDTGSQEADGFHLLDVPKLRFGGKVVGDFVPQAQVAPIDFSFPTQNYQSRRRSLTEPRPEP